MTDGDRRSGAGSAPATAWVHAFSGVAGDMLLGALLDAGAPLDGVRETISALGVPGWSLDAERTERAGLVATRAIVTAPEDPGHHRTSRDIDRLLVAADVPARVRERARSTFAALARAEGRLHGVPPDDVHFHEVGALDAIVDIVGVAAALESLRVDRLVAGPVHVGTGTVRAAHGRLPNPAPATIALLAEGGLATVGESVDVELTTPTGAALLVALSAGASGPLPPMRPVAVGYGAGRRELPDRANAVQVVLGIEEAPADAAMEDLVELAANVDDTTGEVLAHAITALLGAGAVDAWVTPIVMKKGRPAHTVHAVCARAALATVRNVLLAESGSLGVRWSPVQRLALTRTETIVVLDGHPIRVKRAGDRVKVEHDDAVAAAVAQGIPLRDVLARAEALARATR
jgi:pyridinium-3,5-bisthiocarboxylic acid mononucleotide nickel chelatase